MAVGIVASSCVSRPSFIESCTTASRTTTSATPTGTSTTPSQIKELGFVIRTSFEAFLAGNVLCNADITVTVVWEGLVCVELGTPSATPMPFGALAAFFLMLCIEQFLTVLCCAAASN
jgi:hypothetical protein